MVEGYALPRDHALGDTGRRAASPGSSGCESVSHVDAEFGRVPASRSDADELAELRVAVMRASLERTDRFDPERAQRRFRGAFSPRMLMPERR